MHRVRTTLSTTTNPLVLVALVWTLLWGYGATQVALPADRAPEAPEDGTRVIAGAGEEPVWDSAWSRQFPGCVALVLWPRHEEPRAVVARTATGRLVQVAPRGAAVRDGRVVGACR